MLRRLDTLLQRLWPAPALLVWLLAWALCMALQRAQAPWWAQLLLPAAMGWCLALWPAIASTRWRGVFVAAGFPVSAWLLASVGVAGTGHPATPAVWLLPLGLLLLAYPVRAWRDAPVYPTPVGALQGLSAQVVLPQGARVLDAGCGLGHGLLALHAAYPHAQCEGIEWSWPLSWWCRWRCPWARITRGDMWAQDWSAFDLVYVFQRPESMPRIWAKAQRDMKPGAWLVSLAFEVPGVVPQGQWGAVGAEAAARAQAGEPLSGSPRTVWVYQPHR